MKKVRITAMRKTEYKELMKEFENPLDEPCSVKVGDVFISFDGNKPDGLCESAWETMRPFVEQLARGGGDFFDGWMKDSHSAMLSCNDGFRPVSFYIEVIDD